MELADHLFRQEAGRMIAVLTRIFGVGNLARAEDVVQDAFCRAIEVWSYRGVPENPSAWLMATAKHRALDLLRRDRTARTHEPELSRLFESEWTCAPAMENLFSEEAIQDDMLRMMFSCCHPRLSEESQVALALHVLCGFSVSEIAAAFVTSHVAMEKRIPRAKKTLAASKRLFDTTTPSEFAARLPAVQRAIYLLFNEGYHGASAESAVRQQLCREAIRLVALLLRHPLGATPSTYALAALLCLNGARTPARVSAAGTLHPLMDQDRSLWDRQMIADGLRLLEQSAQGDTVSEYHIEAAIASHHAAAARMQDTDWNAIVSLYDSLLALRPSPVVALNRAIAVGQRDGPGRGLEELQAIWDVERLEEYPFYYAALGEAELRLNHTASAREHFQAALALARNPMEERFFAQRLAACTDSPDLHQR